MCWRHEARNGHQLGDKLRLLLRIKDAARFTILLPKSLDPVADGRTVPLPDARPAEEKPKPKRRGRRHADNS